MPFGLIRTLQRLSPPSLETFVSFIKHCKHSCIKFTGESFPLIAVQVMRDLALVVVMYETLPKPDLCDGLCCVDGARSKSSLLRWCHCSCVHAGWLPPSVWCSQPYLAHHLSTNLGNSRFLPRRRLH